MVERPDPHPSYNLYWLVENMASKSQTQGRREEYGMGAMTSVPDGSDRTEGSGNDTPSKSTVIAGQQTVIPEPETELR